MEIREGRFYLRKLTGYPWKVEAVNPNGTVAIVREGKYPEREMVADKETFLRDFEEDWYCPACEGDITYPHRYPCAYGTGN